MSACNYAQALVECGHWPGRQILFGEHARLPGPVNGKIEYLDPFYSGDDLERECIARRQADALIDWIIKNHPQSASEYPEHVYERTGKLMHESSFEHRCDFIKWYFEQMEDNNE